MCYEETDYTQETYQNYMTVCEILENRFKRQKIDVVTVKGLSPYIGQQILNEVSMYKSYLPYLQHIWRICTIHWLILASTMLGILPYSSLTKNFKKHTSCEM